MVSLGSHVILTLALCVSILHAQAEVVPKLSHYILTLLFTLWPGATSPVRADSNQVLPGVDELAGACSYVPAPSETSGDGRTRSGLWGPVQTPSNPWHGQDPRIVAAVRSIVVGLPSMPDGPPLSLGEARRLLEDAVSGESAHVGAFRNGEEHVLVYALDSRALQMGDPALHVSADAVHRVARFRADGTWVLLTGTAGHCFDALQRHVDARLASRGLRQDRR